MPSQAKPLVVLRGSGEYARYLDRLYKAVKRKGVNLKPGRNGLAEYALNVLGFQHDIKAPARMRPHGTNQHGKPKTRDDQPERKTPPPVRPDRR